MFGSYQAPPANAVYFDADANQYYTLNSPSSASNWGGAGGFFNPMLRGLGMGNFAKDRNYLGAVLGGANNKSMVDEIMANRQPYEYNVPSLASLFPSMQNAMQPAAMPMQGNPFQGGSGAGRFMGGLLGAMPTPVSTTTTQAPSSGAGRYL